MWLLSAILWASLWMARMASRSLSASGSVDLNWSWAEIRPWEEERSKGQPRPTEALEEGRRARTSISSMVWTMNMSWRSSMALSIQLLKGAARLAYSRCSWSMVSSCFSVFWCV